MLKLYRFAVDMTKDVMLIYAIDILIGLKQTFFLSWVRLDILAQLVNT